MPQPITANGGEIDGEYPALAMDATHLPVSVLREYNTPNGAGLAAVRWFDDGFYP